MPNNPGRLMNQSRTGLLATVVLHAAALGTLLAYEPTRSALAAAAPIMVDWIAAPKTEPVIAPPEPPKPKPVHHRPKPVGTPKIVAAPLESPSPSPAVVPAPPPPPPPQQIAAVQAPAPEPVVVPPVFNAAYLQNPAPAYPALSRRLHEEGRVVLRVLVNTTGAADQVQLQTSSGFARLDESARTAITRWKFVPAKRGAQPIADWVLIPVNFRLNG
jgi:protein TonB